MGMSSAIHAQDAKKPAPTPEDDEFLEFLGSVDSDADDDAWLEFLAQTDIAKVAKAKKTPPAPEKKTEGSK